MLKNIMLHKGDIVMARTEATYGKTLYVPNDEPAAYASFLIKISFDNSIMDNKFYWFLLELRCIGSKRINMCPLVGNRNLTLEQ